MPPPIMMTREVTTDPSALEKKNVGRRKRPPHQSMWDRRFRLSTMHCLSASLHHVGEGSREGRRAVQALGPRQRHAPMRRVRAEQHIDIVQNFHVIAYKSDGCDHHFAHALQRVAIEARFYGRSQPVAAAHPLTLV